MGLGLSFVLRTLLARILDVAGVGVLSASVAASITFAVTGMAIRYKFPRHSVAMTTAFTAYALLAKLSLVLMNFDTFHSASNSARFPLAVAAVTLPPISAVACAVALEWRAATVDQTEI